VLRPAFLDQLVMATPVPFRESLVDFIEQSGFRSAQTGRVRQTWTQMLTQRFHHELAWLDALVGRCLA
jgi:hypothetical protein